MNEVNSALSDTWDFGILLNSYVILHLIYEYVINLLLVLKGESYDSIQYFYEIYEYGCK